MTERAAEISFGEFADIVDRSFLPPTDKELLKRSARDGVTEQLWRRFDDLLIAALEERKRIELLYKSRLDAEVERYLDEYETEKHTLDLQMREDLTKCAKLGDAEAKALWDEYYRHIANLQEKLLANVRRTSKNVICQAATAVSGNCPGRAG
jgi:hypothetical protein